MYKIYLQQPETDILILRGFVTERSAKIAIELLYDNGSYDERFHNLYVSKWKDCKHETP